jgi:hypothetical protein
VVIRSQVLRAVLAAAGLAAIAEAALTSKAGFLVIAFLLLLPIATSFSQAGRLASSLQTVIRRPVSTVVWGAPIRGATGGPLRVESVGAMGAGLRIHLEGPGVSRTLLKVAQPRSWRLEADRLVIEDAAYVQCAGKRLPRADGLPALEIRPGAAWPLA